MMVASFQRIQSSLLAGVHRVRRQYHVSPACIKISRRSLQSSNNLARPSQSKTESPKFLRAGVLRPAKCLMIRTRSPRITSVSAITKKLSDYLDRSEKQVQVAKRPAVIIFATPCFVQWFETGSFISIILQSVVARSQVPGPGPDITVVAAIVDGIPFPPKGIGVNEAQKNEGFAIMACDFESIRPGLEPVDYYGETSIQDNVLKSNIVFSINTSLNSEQPLEITVPLANTMFRNGRASTLLVSKWKSAPQARGGLLGQWFFSKALQVEKNSVTIHLDVSHPAKPWHFDIPLLCLTPPRRVLFGLGNIVRQVIGAEGKPVPASQELEASVDAYLTARNLEKQTVAVWALIIPNAIISSTENEDRPTPDMERIRGSWMEKDNPYMRIYVGRWLQQGASLHRVLSGGGGWGLKQGLLSLDPETTPINSVDARFDSELTGSADHEHLQALGNIAKPGSWIQFMICADPTPDELVLDIGHEFPIAHGGAKFVFGCIPSTIDDIPQPSSSPPDPTGEEAAGPMIDVFEGFFGVQSESGIFINGAGNGFTIDSKIDVPHSRILWSGYTKKKA